ncbi:hypothetical protein C8J56DRAFT_366453 [Mycena floridula]|nr:hypothetical protein C8J56DRAFT_366453 [Mycena floridula]
MDVVEQDDDASSTFHHSRAHSRASSFASAPISDYNASDYEDYAHQADETLPEYKYIGQSDTEDSKVQPASLKAKASTTGRDAKYAAEKPVIAVVAPAAPVQEEVPNLKQEIIASQMPYISQWESIAPLAHPVPPSNTISKRAQRPELRDVLDKAQATLIGLILFVEALPSKTQMREFCNEALMGAAEELGQHGIVGRLDGDLVYSGYLSKYLQNTIVHFRKSVKKIASGVVAAAYDLNKFESVAEVAKHIADLTTRSLFVFPLGIPSNSMTAKIDLPYRNEAIISVLHTRFFAGTDSLASKYETLFQSSCEDDDSLEIPAPMLYLVANRYLWRPP